MGKNIFWDIERFDIIYLDDTLIFSKTLEEQNVHAK